MAVSALHLQMIIELYTVGQTCVVLAVKVEIRKQNKTFNHI